MYWTKPFNEWFPIVKRGNEKIDDENIPAWSLHRLCLLFRTVLEDETQLTIPLKNTYDEIIDAFEIVIKEGHFNKEYIENF